MAQTKRTGRAQKAEHPPVPSALVVKGLNGDDIAALEAELVRRRSRLSGGATISRNNLVVALIREALREAEKGAAK